MALTKKQKKWIAETSRILDEVDKMDPNDPALAPWQTENWRRKGEGMLTGLKPVGDRIRKKGDK